MGFFKEENELASDKYFYNSNGDTIPTSYVEDAKQDYKGKTLDGDAVYHTVFYDAERRKHISYDTVVVNGIHHYIMGSGHERAHDAKEISKWDIGKRINWEDALGRRTNSLIK